MLEIAILAGFSIIINIRIAAGQRKRRLWASEFGVMPGMVQAAGDFEPSGAGLDERFEELEQLSRNRVPASASVSGDGLCIPALIQCRCQSLGKRG